jgi:hypothetical protein
MTHDTRARDAIERLIDADDAIVALEGAVDAGRPWPLPPVEGDDPESAWGPPEILAHVAEMLGYWLAQMERVIAASGEVVPMGRVAGDTLRAQAIETGRTLPTRELVARIRSAIGRYVVRLPELTAEDWGQRGIHPRVGELTVAEMLDRFVLGHLDEHVAQLNHALEARADTGGRQPD